MRDATNNWADNIDRKWIFPQWRGDRKRGKILTRELIPRLCADRTYPYTADYTTDTIETRNRTRVTKL